MYQTKPYLIYCYIYQSFCATRGSQLLTIHDDEENNWIWSTVGELSYVSNLTIYMSHCVLKLSILVIQTENNQYCSYYRTKAFKLIICINKSLSFWHFGGRKVILLFSQIKVATNLFSIQNIPAYAFR